MPSLDALGEALAPLLGGFLPRQRWYAGSEPPADVAVTTLDAREGDPLLVWLLVDAIGVEDFPQIQASILCIAAIYCIANLIVDLLYPLVDPRVRLG